MSQAGNALLLYFHHTKKNIFIASKSFDRNVQNHDLIQPIDSAVLSSNKE
jgi:hypothetical protein